MRIDLCIGGIGNTTKLRTQTVRNITVEQDDEGRIAPARLTLLGDFKAKCRFRCRET